MACDVRHREDIDRALGLTLHHFDRVDVWVNNAGVGLRDSVAEVDIAAFRHLFEANFFGVVACMQAVIPTMRDQGGGAIINVSSVAGHLPIPFMASYSASKFAMNALGKAARLELRHDNIDVVTVCPGYVATGFGEHVLVNRRPGPRPATVRGITAERVARATFLGYQKRRREVIVPWTMIPVVKLYQLFPGLVEWGMTRRVPAMKAENRGSQESAQ